MPKATHQGREELVLNLVWPVAFLLPLRARNPRGQFSEASNVLGRDLSYI